MSDKIKINLGLGGTYFPLTIPREDEEKVREAAHRVNKRLNLYKSHYGNLPLEKMMPMVAYHFSLEVLELENKNDTKPYIDKIEELDALIEKNL